MKSENINIRDKARALRKNMTPAEKLLWTRLRKRQVLGFKFRRQHVLGDSFIVDFYCHKKKLIIEVDGSIHDTIEIAKNDAVRQDYLEKNGMTVIRFSNKKVFSDLNQVISSIKLKLSDLNK